MGWIFRTFSLSFIPTKSNHPGRFFLRGVSPHKVFDASRLACHPCGCQAGGVLRYRRVIASFPPVYRWGKDVHCIVGVLGSLTRRYDSVIARNGGGPVSQLLKRNPKGLWSACYVRLTTRQQYVRYRTRVHDQVFFTTSSSTTRHTMNQVTSIHRHANFSTEFSIMQYCSQTRDLKPRYSSESMIS